ncbi:MAG: heavy-metal-associated domain-containing protein [Ignavibacteria bacterium]|nr:heavy-metal-associated domain-containing protein [Ignavibacteria bacterium]
MKSILIVFSLIITVLLYSGCGKTDNKTVSEKKSTTEESKSESSENNINQNNDNATLQVSSTDKSVEIQCSGMTCTGCEKSIKGKVKKVNGVKDVIADHTTNIVKASFDPALTNTDAIKGAIEAAGYKVVSIK